jgi:radical SAM protein with 4Fe4S-binding SPASM domain
VVRANLASLVGTELGAGAGPAELRRQWQRERAAARARYLAACAAGQHDRLPPVTAALFDDDLIAWNHRASGPPHSGVRGGCCLPGVRRTHVQVDGRLQPCERVSEDLVIGAAGTGPQPGRIEAVRARFRAAVGRRCVNCWAVRFCDVCYTALEGHGGGIPAARCQAVRRHAGDLLRLVADLRAAGPQALSWLEDTTVD